MLIQKLRLQRGWSQEQLAELSGLSVRTVQRIEKGQLASAESLKSLASVFDIEFSILLPLTLAGAKEQAMSDATFNNTSTHIGQTQTQTQTQTNPMLHGVSNDEALALRHVRAVRGFYYHAAQYAVIITGLVILNIIVSPHKIWAIYPALGWGLGLAAHAFGVFTKPKFFGADWEKRQVEKFLKRPL